MEGGGWSAVIESHEYNHDGGECWSLSIREPKSAMLVCWTKQSGGWCSGGGVGAGARRRGEPGEARSGGAHMARPAAAWCAAEV